MTRSEREQLIERYLREELTPSEEQDFFIEAATDKELRFDLKASRLVENTFRKDRETAPTSYGPMRDHLAQLLAASRAGESSTQVEKEAEAGVSAQFGKRNHLGWIVTAASIGLLSLISLFVGILAIDKAGEEKVPAAIEGKRETAGGAEFNAPQLSAPETSVDPVEEGTGITSTNEVLPTQENTRNGIGETKPATSAATTQNVEQNQNTGGKGGIATPPNSTSHKAPPESSVDTTDPNYDGRLEFEGPN